MTKTTISIEIARICKWDLNKAEKVQRNINVMKPNEQKLFLESMQINEELAMGIVNEERLERFNKLFKTIYKHRKEICMVGCLTVFIVVQGAMAFANPSMQCFAATTATATTTNAVASMPSVNMGEVTSMVSKLIKNLITLGILATVASCCFDMLKSILEGNISKLPKTLISYGLMCACVLISPSVFNFISSAFNMGNVIGF